MTDEQKPMCQHCGQEVVTRPRGLGWKCYYADGVKELYPSTSKYASRGTGNGTGRSRKPARATTALPRTPEKIAVMQARAERGESLFHPKDATIDQGDVPDPHRWIGGKGRTDHGTGIEADFRRDMEEAA